MADAGLIFKDDAGIIQDTNSFNALFNETEQTNAKKIIANETSNSLDAKGSDC